MYYHFADLIIRSELTLTELPVAPPGPAVCRVRSGTPEAPHAAELRWDHRWPAADGGLALSCARDGDAYRIGVPGLGTFAVEDGGGQITCHPVEGLPASTLQHILIDQVLPRALALSGNLVLHAGCVLTPFGAIGFLGDSGAGKSTLCGAFARAGHPLMGDDGIFVRQSPRSGHTAIATYPGLRLQPSPLAHLFDDDAAGRPVAHYTEKCRLDTHHEALPLAMGAAPLRALYVLGEGSALDVDDLPQREAFMALVGAAFQLHLDDPGRSRRLFSQIGLLQEAVPVRRLTYPRDLARLAEVRAAVLADVGALALPARAAG